MREYRVIYVTLQSAQEQMNHMAKQGWRVVSTSAVDDGLNVVKLVITFER